MRLMRIGIIAVVVVTAALAGGVMMGTADAGKTATYYACADGATGALRRVPPEEPCADGEERLVWSDGQPEPTPPPSKHLRHEVRGEAPGAESNRSESRKMRSARL